MGMLVELVWSGSAPAWLNAPASLPFANRIGDFVDGLFTLAACGDARARIDAGVLGKDDLSTDGAPGSNRKPARPRPLL